MLFLFRGCEQLREGAAGSRREPDCLIVISPLSSPPPSACADKVVVLQWSGCISVCLTMRG